MALIVGQECMIYRIVRMPLWGDAYPARVLAMKGVDICRNKCPVGVLVEGGYW